MMGKFLYWGPLVWQTKVSLDIVDELRKDADSLTVEDNDYRHGLAGIIKEEKQYTLEQIHKYEDKLNPYLSAYINTLLERWNPEWNYHLQDKSLSLELQDLWVNYQRAGEYNPEHFHSGDISFVIYLQVPDELKTEESAFRGHRPGAIKFQYGWLNNVKDRNNLATLALENVNQHIFLPETAEMVVFPSSTFHSVSAFYSDVERISVSGNLKFHVE